MTLRRVLRVLSCLVLSMAVVGPAVAQEDLPASERLEKAKALYASAAYEEALSLLRGLALADEEAAEAARYRAFCLIALGRTDDATRAIELVVTEDPTFAPSLTELSPRVFALFNDTRRKLLPDVLVGLYREGRTAFDGKAHERALEIFERVGLLSNDEAIHDVPEIADLRVLAGGFADLSRAALSAAAPAATAVPPRNEQPSPSPQGTSSGPVVIRQDLPRWSPASRVNASRAFEGSVKVMIGTDGKVR